MRLKKEGIVKESKSYDMNIIIAFLREELDKAFSNDYVEEDWKDPEYCLFNASVNIDVHSKFVHIKSLRADCNIEDSEIRFVGMQRPDPDFLDPDIQKELGSRSYYSSSYLPDLNMFEGFVYLKDGKTTDEVLSEVKDAVSKFIKDKEITLGLWKEMQEKLNQYDSLRDKMESLQFDFNERLKQTTKEVDKR